ncbi:ferritin-like domain-containing protein [Hydrocarboniphaga sp.]|uniref:ferritin-like domain-containing protein n=1 Tax=Hydrocarboniphaga sp. TaxID=2033016 RepID=UPI003D0BC83D
MAAAIDGTTRALDRLRHALQCCDPAAKCAAVASLVIDDDSYSTQSRIRVAPGRPERLQLVRPRDVPVRGLGTPEGRTALVHAIAHIEFNAMNLALDACLSFGGMPDDYYEDWLSVARDEARHFALLSARLQTMGHEYGDFPAHNGLWEQAEKTAHDVLVRMALVPRVLEARGLDVTPGMIARLNEVRDQQTAAILRVILDEEVRHVAIGTQWFRWCCEQRALEPDATFLQLLADSQTRIRPPVNWPARVEAGFNLRELPADVGAML